MGTKKKTSRYELLLCFSLTLMAASVDTASPSSAMASPLLSPSSDKRFWSNLRGRVDSLLETRFSDHSSPTQIRAGKSDRADQLKEDSLLLLRGFDSISNTLSQLSNNLDNALQGARDLAGPPTLTDIFHTSLKSAEIKEVEGSEVQENEKLIKIGLKRKYDPNECSEEEGDDAEKKVEQNPKNAKLNKAKNLALSMATKAATFARELKSIKSDLCFMQERCTILEEENRRLRDGFVKGIRPEEDDLVRLQLEALLAEKSRLANENANLTRENQCLHQLVEYHQITSQDLSASYEQVIQGMCLDFSSPEPNIAEEADDEADSQEPVTPRNNFSFPSLEDQ